jgi:asparagine synthase (glutamine-hydrolysing)
VSGISGLLNLDGAPVDRGLLERMTASLAFRGPETVCAQPAPCVGLGHALLHLTDGPDRNEQPLTIDGREWIVADARIDARPDLEAALGRHARLEPARCDAELILRAYRAWGEDCVTRLLGDFTFAIWDAAERRLFCARDHLGVRPFYYAVVDRTVVFSNTLDCVRLHPAVSRELHDPAIADFLLFGANQESDTTTFRDIRRLPPAHSITWRPGHERRRRYWTLPIDEPLAFRRIDDCTDRFMELLRPAVADRLRSRRVAVLMSGGLDSTTLAAVARDVLAAQPGPFTLQAVTSVYDRLIPDSERRYASLVARHLDIPISFDVRDRETSIADWESVTVHTPEPVDNPPAFAAGVEFLRSVSDAARVVLYGEGPDDALRYEWRPYLRYLLARRRTGALFQAIASDLLMHPRVPLWSSVRHLAGARRVEARWRQAFPDWLDVDFAKRSGCRERWDAHQHPPPSPHPIRPSGYQGFSAASWQQLFEACDIQGAMARSEFRHPFLDVRLLQYMLALPAIPWCRRKLVLRRAMRGVLPRAVLRRKKASLSESPDLARVAASGFPRLVPAPRVSQYVDVRRIPMAPRTVVELRAALRPLGLNYWLQDLAGR